MKRRKQCSSSRITFFSVYYIPAVHDTYTISSTCRSERVSMPKNRKKPRRDPVYHRRDCIYLYDLRCVEAVKKSHWYIRLGDDGISRVGRAFTRKARINSSKTQTRYTGIDQPRHALSSSDNRHKPSRRTISRKTTCAGVALKFNHSKLQNSPLSDSLYAYIYIRRILQVHIQEPQKTAARRST